MRKLWLALILALCLGHAPARAQGIIGPPNQIGCNLGVQVAIGTMGVTQVLALITGQRIYICGWQFTNTAATGTFQLSTGTGSNCGTGNTVLTPVLSVGVSPTTDRGQNAILQTPISQALCANPSVTTVSGMIWAAQF